MVSDFICVLYDELLAYEFKKYNPKHLFLCTLYWLQHNMANIYLASGNYFLKCFT